MQKFVLGSALTLVLGFASCQQSANQPAIETATDSTEQVTDSLVQAIDTTFVSVNAEEFEKAIAEEGVQLVDVRGAEEYAEGHIKGSLNLDLKAEGFVENAKQALNKDNTVAVYCRTGRRSKEAAKLLTLEGYNIVELNGGFTEWKESQREIEK